LQDTKFKLQDVNEELRASTKRVANLEESMKKATLKIDELEGQISTS
jgi:hypothetical protein